MDAKEYLQNVQKCIKHLDYLTRIIKKNHIRESEILEDVKSIINLRLNTLYLIHALPNPKHVHILYKRYIIGDSWERISLDMGVGVNHLCEWVQPRALKEFQSTHETMLKNVQLPELKKYGKTVVLSIDRKQVKSDYLAGMPYVDISRKYNLSLNTLKGWIKRYKWAEERRK
ncbi:hypothetical protein GCM10008910_45540 [Faecalicatena orotica]|uniref:Uncharacterized protein n=1 Tax=Faecalicatena orotica TaxID=1544 RepID=A0A2Y9BJQ8_9FIRM|nr:helix-turn-helix domain-containing protein [Faecalicatena orotica]PWJ29502.1 hypothetical protein A8806_106241 [Faecalicatena orotica]SSA55957.1 hypothetical protein SAMN05216536_106241 [Faecalicatena orotica]